MLRRGIVNKFCISAGSRKQQQQQYSILVPADMLRPSQSDAEARYRILVLYRYICRSLGVVRDRFHVPLDIPSMQRRVRMDFEKHRNQQISRSLIDAMVFRGHNELEEMKRQHQTRSQVLKYFAQAEPIAKRINYRSQGTKTTSELQFRGSLMHTISDTLKQNPNLTVAALPEDKTAPPVAPEKLPLLRGASVRHRVVHSLKDEIAKAKAEILEKKHKQQQQQPQKQ